MGTRGPLPKNPEDRQRRNKPDPDDVATVVALPEKVPAPSLNDLRKALGEAPHPIVMRLWQALLDSPVQRELWQPSDWEYAVFSMFAVNEMIRSNKGVTAMMLAAVDTMMSKLLVTEADRRRLKIEVKKVEAEDQLVNASALFRERFDAMRNGS